MNVAPSTGFAESKIKLLQREFWNRKDLWKDLMIGRI